MALTTKLCKGGEGMILSFRTNVSGDNTLIAAPGASSIILVTQFAVIGVGGDVSVYFKTGSDTHFGGSDLAMTLNADGPAGGLMAQFSEGGHFSGGPNEALKLTLSAAEGVIGMIGFKIIGG